MPIVPPEVFKDLVPTGKLRAAINLGNIVLAQGTPDAPRGVTVDLAHELGRRLGVSVELKCFDAAGKSFEHKVYRDAPGGHAFNRLDTKFARESRAEAYRFLAKYLTPPNPVK